jgi:3-deoxy-manno-octulosonate cytidylyltransferase (CMP-KDO synthetase)
MKFTVGVIPARLASTRFPRKMLASIGAKPMVQHVYERAMAARKLDRVMIACDDEQIAEACRAFGGEYVMTPPELQSGTDRVARAAETLEADYVLNIQGDEPLMSPRLIDDLVEAMHRDPGAVMGTAVRRLKDRDDWLNPNVVKAVLDHQGYALYFSRSPIPFHRDAADKIPEIVYKHLGIYAYKKDFLLDLTRRAPSYLETTERLEQLRVLQAGYRIKTIVTEFDSVGIDTPEDLNKLLESGVLKL